MTKVVTLASLLRVAARNEDDFNVTCQAVIDECNHERSEEFFGKLNIPRSVDGLKINEPLVPFTVKEDQIGSFPQERAIGNAIQKFMDRHERKIKWHSTHPAMEGSGNVMFIMRVSATITNMRLERIHLLLSRKDELTTDEWAASRELINRAFLGYRNQLRHMANEWTDAMNLNLDPLEFAEQLGNFYELVDGQVRLLDGHRQKIEARRVEMSVKPEGFPTVKPPNYFGGDLMSVGPWSQYWNNIIAKAHHFRESVG